MFGEKANANDIATAGFKQAMAKFRQRWLFLWRRLPRYLPRERLARKPEEGAADYCDRQLRNETPKRWVKANCDHRLFRVAGHFAPPVRRNVNIACKIRVVAAFNERSISKNIIIFDCDPHQFGLCSELSEFAVRNSDSW